MPLPPDSIHFGASLPYNYCQPLISVGSLVEQGKLTEAVNEMAANVDMVAAALGAVDYYRQQCTPPPVTPPSGAKLIATLAPNGVPSAPFAINPGDLDYAQCGAPGVFTWAPGGSQGCWASLDPTFPNDQWKTAWGAGTCQLRINTAAAVYIKVDVGTYPAATVTLNPA